MRLSSHPQSDKDTNELKYILYVILHETLFIELQRMGPFKLEKDEVN